MVHCAHTVNLHRRHLSAGQQAAIVASAPDWAKAQRRGGDRRSDPLATLPFDSVASRAAISKAGERTQRMADTMACADPALAQEVAHGKISLPKAAEQVRQRRLRPAKKITKSAQVRLGKLAAVQAEQERIAAEAFGDQDDLLNQLERANAEILRLGREVEVLSASDLAEEALKWQRMHTVAVLAQSEAMDRVRGAEERDKRAVGRLRRCGLAVGEIDPSEIPAAVEAFVRTHRGPAK